MLGECVGRVGLRLGLVDGLLLGDLLGECVGRVGLRLGLLDGGCSVGNDVGDPVTGGMHTQIVDTLLLHASLTKLIH